MIDRIQGFAAPLIDLAFDPEYGAYVRGLIALAAALAVFLAYLGIRRLRRRRRVLMREAMAAEMVRSLRHQKLIAGSIVALFFGGFMGWASIFELASAAIAPGFISPDGAKRPVQHLEGGIVSQVLVKDGDRVAEGQPLLVLEDVRARSQVNVLADERAILQVRLDRLMAERHGDDDFRSSVPASASLSLAQAIADEADQFKGRRQSLQGQLQILDARVAQLNEEIQGLEDQIAAVDVQAGLIQEEVDDVQYLVDKGLERRSRLLALQRRQSELDGERAGAIARIARSNQAIGESQSQMESIRFQFMERVDQEAAQVRSEIIRIDNQLEAQTDVLTRTTVTAPASGIVVGLKFTSTQAVIKPGDVILEIVPDDAELLVDAHVSPVDIDDVREGQVAQVHLSAYKQRQMPRVEGTVRYVSADRYVDERTGQSYFLARIAVDTQDVELLGRQVEILPGMPADVMIEVGHQTMLDYLIGPLIQSLGRSFRET